MDGQDEKYLKEMFMAADGSRSLVLLTIPTLLATEDETQAVRPWHIGWIVHL